MSDLSRRGPRPTAERALREREAHLDLALDAAGLATWEWFVPEDRVVWSDRMYVLYGYVVGGVEPDYATWASHIHPDDRPAVDLALERAMEGEPDYAVEFRIVPAGGGERWIEARGRLTYDEGGAPLHLIGVVGDVTERKEKDAALRAQAEALTAFDQVNTALAGTLDLGELVQAATDAATRLSGAQFGAFFYNVTDEAGESFTLYTISGVAREAFERFPMPRNTAVFGPTFRAEGVVRSDDITQDPRYGRNAPYHGLPDGHLPVRSYLAVPVVSRSGEVHGGLFFGHERPGVFTDPVGHLVEGIAAQAAVAIDNARLYEAAQREIADRKATENALRESEERFRRLVLSLPAAVYTTDREGLITLFNEEAAELWGRWPELGTDRWCGSWRIFRPDGAPLPLDECPMAVTLREGRSVRGQEIVVERPDGARVHVVAYPEPLLDAAGAMVGAVNMLIDVTGIREAERDRALLAAIVDSSDDAIISKSLDGVISSWNAAAERLLGYTAAEAIGKPIRMLFPEDRQNEGPLILSRIQRGERVEHFETVRRTKDGRDLDVALTVSPVRSSDGRVVGASKILRDITLAKQAEVAVLESEDRFRVMTDSAPMLVWMAGADRQCTHFNRGWLAFTGRTMDEELGDGWRESVHPDDLGRCLDVYAAHYDRREPFEVEYRLCHHDEQYRWIVDRGAPRFAPDGAFLGFIGSGFDVHDRKLAETHAAYLAATGTLVEQALDSEATLQQVARLAVPGFSDWCLVDVLDGEGSIQVLAIAHTDPEKVRWGWELRASEPMDLDAPTGTPNVIRTGKPEHYPHVTDEMLIATARDEDHLRLLRGLGFSSVMVVPLRVGDEVAGAVTFVNTESGRRFDESDLATAAEIGRRAGGVLEVARLHEALTEREARFRQLAEALPQIVYTSGPDGRVDYLNRRWYDYTGQAESVDPGAASAGVVHPDDLAALGGQYAEARVAARPFESELRLQRADGAYRWVLTRVVPVLDADGAVARWFGTSTDIHAQKEAEAELARRVAERTAELERSNRELDQFAYVASHDLKGPLRGIDNLASWIAEDAAGVLPDESRRHLGLLRGRVQRLEALLESLLVYSRAGRTSGMAEPVDVAALLRDVVDVLDLPAGFTVEPAGPLPTLETYRAPLELVFRNLVSNAVKHHDRPDGHVRVSARVAGRFAEFTVADDGPGIAPEYHERAFELFQTLRPRDEVEGSGMGLAVVKKTTESLGGTVRVESTPGAGAAFTFTWPLTV
ncbi:MAG TPA: PAS domain S-box protein [Rubricoccaceae bacterium]